MNKLVLTMAVIAAALASAGARAAEGNNLAAVEQPAGTGVYYSATVVAGTVIAAPASTAPVLLALRTATPLAGRP